MMKTKGKNESQNKLQYQTFPKSLACSEGAKTVIDCFEIKFSDIDSSTHTSQESDEVLAKVCDELQKKGFRVETGKKEKERITRSVLFGLNGRPEKEFYVDAHSEEYKTVVEIEAGQAVTNFRFLKDLFEACQMPDVEHLVIAVRNTYNKSNDFAKVCRFLETVYVNGRLVFPLKSITIIGY